MAMGETYTKIQKAYRAKFLKLQKKLEREFEAIADEFDGKIQRLVFKYSKSDRTFDKRLLTEINREIDAIADWFTKTNATWIDKNIVQSVEFAIDNQDMAAKAFIRAAAQGYQGKGREMLVEAATDPAAPFLLRTQFGTGLAGYIRKAVWKRRWVDGRALNDRIWETDRALRKNLHGMIEQCIDEGLSAVEFSRAVEQYLLKPGPAWTTKITPSVTGRGSIKYNALRLARTETNNAYRLAHSLGAQNSSIVKGIKWNLSHSHPEPDICDEWATQDLYGLGPGVYPPDKLPPGHPNCLCYLTDILLQGEELVRALEEKYQTSILDGMKYSEPIKDGLFPEKIAGVKRGSPMTRDDANGRKANPNFDKSNGYKINCQSCVVTYEARLRGYDVQTLPNTKGSVLEELSKQTNLAWIDPATGKHPNYIFDDTATTPKKFKDFLESVVKPNERYTLQFSWRGRSREGHIICMDRDADGLLRLYDPQNGYTYDGINVNRYLDRIKYTMTVGGIKMPARPKILRIDDKHFNLDIVDHIMEGVSK